MRGEDAVAAATIRSARSFNFAEPARRSTIHGPKTLPEEAKAAVVIWFSATLVAVPAFNRVDPATTSGPVSRRTRISAVSSMPGDPLAVTSTVVAPRSPARSSAPRTNAVTELAETPMTRSPRRTPPARRAPSS